MADEDGPAGGGWKNISDTFTTTGAFRSAAAWIWYTLTRNIRHNYEKTVEEGLAAGETRRAAAHGHGELTQVAGDSDGVVWRKPVYTKTWKEADGTRYGSYTVTDAAWTTLDFCRAFTHGFRGVRIEVEVECASDIYFQVQTVYRGIRGGAAEDHELVEPSAGAAYASMIWHTLAGQIDAAGATDVEQLPTGTPVSMEDTRNLLDRWDFVLAARLAAGEGSDTLLIKNLLIREALDAD